jgi:hypothetical protein
MMSQQDAGPDGPLPPPPWVTPAGRRPVTVEYESPDSDALRDLLALVRCAAQDDHSEALGVLWRHADHEATLIAAVRLLEGMFATWHCVQWECFMRHCEDCLRRLDDGCQPGPDGFPPPPPRDPGLN